MVTHCWLWWTFWSTSLTVDTGVEKIDLDFSLRRALIISGAAWKAQRQGLDFSHLIFR